MNTSPTHATTGASSTLCKTNITCVLNAHKESHLVYPSIKSVQRAVSYARECGLEVEFLVALDRSDEATSEIVRSTCDASAIIEEIDYGDLAHSRNHAVEAARGTYVAFLDGDDLWGKSWLADAYIMAESESRDVVLHPQYNVYFGDGNDHVLQHVDMESRMFTVDFLYERNYWTALSFAKRELYRRFPYEKNTIRDGFGYEDWTWHFETIAHGVIHKVVPSTCHFIRRGKSQASLLDQTNGGRCLPRVLDIYRRRDEELPIPLSKAA